MPETKQYEQVIWSTALRFHKPMFLELSLEDMIQELWVALLEFLQTNPGATFSEIRIMLRTKARKMRKNSYKEQRARKGLQSVQRHEQNQPFPKYSPGILELLQDVNRPGKWDQILVLWSEYFNKLSIEDQTLINMYKQKSTQTEMAAFFHMSRQGVKKWLQRILEGFRIYHATR